MSQPPSPYERSYSFTDNSTANPTSQQPGQKIDQELNAARTAINATQSRLAEVQADDGKVRNSALNLPAIAEAVEPLLTTAPITAVNNAGAAQVTAVNAAGATQLSAVNTAGASIVTIATDAQSSAIASAAARDLSQNYAANSLSYANTASSHANNALGYKNSASGYASAANTSAGQAADSASASANAYSSAVTAKDAAVNAASYAQGYANAAEASKMAALDAKADAEAAANTAQSIVDNGAAQIVADVQPYLDDAAASATSAHNSANDALTSKTQAAASASVAVSAASSISISVGSVTTVSPGSSATVDITGTAPTYTLNFNIPQGNDGGSGPAGNDGSNGSDGAQGPQGPMGQGLNQRGTWAYATYYYPGDVVVDPSNYLAYVCYNSVYSYNNPSSDPSFWSNLSIVGPQGPAGNNGSDGSNGSQGPAGPAGTTLAIYDDNIAYNADDITVYSGYVWRCTNATTASSGMYPATSSTNWEPINAGYFASQNWVSGNYPNYSYLASNYVTNSTYTSGLATKLGIAGGTMTGKLTTLTSASTGAGFNLPHGAAPTTPVNGDIWTTGGALLGYFAGTTRSVAFLTGGTFTGPIILPAGSTTTASFRIPHGSPPTSPVSGDIWTTAGGLFASISGVNRQFAPLSGGTFTGVITTLASATTGAGLNLPHGAAPTTPVNGDVWTTTSGVFTQLNGSTRSMAFNGAWANTYAAGSKQSVSHSAASAGLNIGPVAAGITSPVAGDMWQNSANSQITGYTNSMPSAMTACRAFVNFNGVGNATWPGGASTVTRVAASTTCTVTTTTTHNLTTGNAIWALTGVVAGSYVVTVLTSTTFTFTTVETTALTAAAITFAVNTIRSSYNVTSVTDNGVADYTVNFTTPMVDTNYATICTSNWVGGNNGQWNGQLALHPTVGPTASAVRLQQGAIGDFTYCTVAVFR